MTLQDTQFKGIVSKLGKLRLGAQVTVRIGGRAGAGNLTRLLPPGPGSVLLLPPVPAAVSPPIALSHLLLSWPCRREEGPIHHFTGGSILKVTLAGLAVSPQQVAVQPQLDCLSLLLSETASFICRAAGVWLR